jgi:hypothetical protein
MDEIGVSKTVAACLGYSTLLAIKLSEVLIFTGHAALIISCEAKSKRPMLVLGCLQNAVIRPTEDIV